MVYLLPGTSSPVVVELVLVKAAIKNTARSSSLEQPTEVSLCHLNLNLVTTVPLGILPEIVMVVDVTDMGSESTAADGTVV